jgi:putative transposase
VWLLEPHRRTERALFAVVADSYFARVSTGRLDKLVRLLGIEGMSKSQVSKLAAELDEILEAFRSRPPDSAPTPTCVSVR